MNKFWIAALLLPLTGCATVIKGSSDTVSVNSLEKGTTISIDGAPRGIDVAQANLKKGKPYTIRASKEGCQTVEIETTESFDATTLLGILLDFGIFTVTTDLISGAAWKIEPTTYTVSPLCNGTATS